MIILAFTISGLISFLICKWIAKKSKKLGLIDIPNRRSSHAIPTPRGGGIGIVLSVFIFTIIFFLLGIIKNTGYIFLTIGAIFIALVGFFSDRFNTSSLYRIIIQIFIAGISVWLLGDFTYLNIGNHILNLEFLGLIFNVILLVAITNFYNFMDGIDGLAASQGVITGIGLVAFGIILKENSLVAIGSVLSGATCGFLLLNISPAKIFMGDTGSYFLGFYLAYLTLIHKQLLIPIILILGVFLFDTVVTLTRRIMKKERWYRAHRSHFYQRAISLGYTHMQTTLIISLISFLFLIMACIYLLASVSIQLIILCAALLILVTLSFWITIKEKKKSETSL